MHLDLAIKPVKAGIPPSSRGQPKAAFEGCDDLNVVIARTSRFRLDAMQKIDIRTGKNGAMSVSRQVRLRPGHGVTDPLGKCDTYSICVHLQESAEVNVWRDDRAIPSSPMTLGSVQIADMRHQWRADIQSAFDVVNFSIPQSTFDEFAEDDGAHRIDELRCAMDNPRPDLVLANLARALLPALETPRQANTLFADYAARAVGAHLVQAYGNGPIRARYGKGGLTPWQEKRAKDMLHANLAGQVTLADLAGACRLSCSQFSQAFRRSVGYPPHQWLLVQRVERAKDLLLNSDLPLSQIALDAGFCDQSHFTRVFVQRVKASPAAWRRAQTR